MNAEVCSKCGNENVPGSRFCDKCGQPLARDEARSKNLLADAYVLEKGIGEGGMGAVYLGHRRGEPEKKVAIKFLLAALHQKKEAVARFGREAEIMGEIDHPNVMPVLEHFQDNQNQFAIIMPFLAGGTLEDWLAENHPGELTEAYVERVQRIFDQILEGVSVLHKRGIVHRDLKLQNILLDGERDRPVLCDMGIAHIAGEDKTRLTKTSQGLGTLHCMAPEQHRGKGASEASDVYALGIILFEMLTNTFPYDLGEETLFDIANAHLNEIPRFTDVPQNVSQATLDFMRRALEKEPEDRFANASEMLAAFPHPMWGPREINVYVREEVIGEGGMGVVHKGYRRDDPATRLALKSLHNEHTHDPMMLGRFRREAEIMSRIDHPNVMPILDRIDTNDDVSIVMPFLEGGTLVEVINGLRKSRSSKQKLTRPEVNRLKTITGEILSGVGELHAHKVIHRDLKPQNVLFTKSGRVLISDMGVARVEKGSQETQYTRDSAPGTMLYMAPEQHANKPPAESMDQYACGLLLFEMLTGMFPYNVSVTSSAYQIAAAHLRAEPNLDLLPPNCTKELRAALSKMLAKNPDERFSSVEEARAHLMHIAWIRTWICCWPPPPWLILLIILLLISGGVYLKTRDNTSEKVVDKSEAVAPAPIKTPGEVGVGDKPEETSGEVAFQTVPENATVFWNGTQLQPSSTGTRKINALPGKEVKIKVEHEGYYTFEKTFTPREEDQGLPDRLELKPVIVWRITGTPSKARVIEEMNGETFHGTLKGEGAAIKMDPNGKSKTVVIEARGYRSQELELTEGQVEYEVSLERKSAQKPPEPVPAPKPEPDPDHEPDKDSNEKPDPYKKLTVDFN